ncbi:MAG: hypothetical protein NT062_22045, partial [Proteobacteria bacterium]|nr:hypothetical protein [Pseudomonadota bacterium]
MPELRFSRRIAAAIRAGDAPTDESFDRFMPSELERVSSTFWTPIEVVMRVASWLADLEVETVMDIGSGAGKFCVVAALAGTARFVGIEQRPR